MKKFNSGFAILVSTFFLGCGSTDDSFSPPPSAPQLREYIVIPNRTGAFANTVSVRGIDLTTGNTAQLASASTGTNPTMVRCHPTRNLFYVTNTGSNNISAFIMDGNGLLTPVPGSPFAGPAGARSVHIHPNGLYVYVAGSSVMQSYSVNVDGSITPQGATAAMVSTPRNDGGFSNNGQFLHIPVSNGVQTFSVTPGTGILTANSNNVIAGIATVNDVSVYPNGTQLLTTCQMAGASNDKVVPFTINANGTLTPGADQVQTFDIGLGQISRDGIYYVGDLNNPQVRGFSVGAGGALTALAGSPFSAPGGGSLTTLDPSESLVFSAPNGTGSLASSRRLSSNALQAGGNSPFTDNLSDLYVWDFFQFTQL